MHIKEYRLIIEYTDDVKKELIYKHTDQHAVNPPNNLVIKYSSPRIEEVKITMDIDILNHFLGLFSSDGVIGFISPKHIIADISGK